MTGVVACADQPPAEQVSLESGFDWGSDCSAGSGSFSEYIPNNATTTIGTIPANKRNVRIELRSAEDVDVQLVDEATGHEIIAWPNGDLNGAGEACTTYQGVQYCYSGYNGVGGQLGHEWIEVRGDTNRTLVMKAFGYAAGDADVSYTWEAVDTCNETGSGSFAQYVPKNDVADVGVIPAGKVNVRIRLVAPYDADIQLYDGSVALVQWPNGQLSGAGRQTLSYQGMTIVWSGYNGDGTGLGHEYINIDGEVTRDLTMKVFGYAASQADVTYSWGDGTGDACTSTAGCGPGLACKGLQRGPGACHTRTWCESTSTAPADCAALTPPTASGAWECETFVCSWVPGGGGTTLRSNYLRGDAEAQALIDNGGTVTLPTTGPAPVGDLTWRVINAMRMAGYDRGGVRNGAVIDGARLLQIDDELVAAEAVIASQAAKLPDYAAISGPDFRDNIPQAFAAHLFATSFELLNAGPTSYQTLSNECVWANLVPQMCGALVDMGVEEGSTSCKTSTAVLRQNQIVQTPELFGFNNVRREIGADELPSVGDNSTMSYVSTLIHEFVHDLDARWSNWSPMHAQYDRRVHCSPTLVDFQAAGSPFVFTGANGTQDPRDFISEYGAGVNNPNQDYRPYEDVAESVTGYVLLPEYFRLRAAGSATLQAKYDYIRTEMFGGVEFENPNLVVPAGYTFPTKVGTWNAVNHVERFRITDIRVK